MRNVRVKIRDLVQDDEEFLKRQSAIEFTESDVVNTRHKAVVVPSYGVTSGILARHFHTMEILRNKITLLH